MNRRNLIWGGIVAGGGLLFVLVLSLMASPSERNWDPTWAGKDRNPFGASVLKQAVREFVAPAEMVSIFESPAEEDELYWIEDCAYFSVNELFDPTDEEWVTLQTFAYNGNLVMIAASALADQVSETLGLALIPPSSTQDPESAFSDSVSVFFRKTGWKDENWTVPQRYVGQIAPLNTGGLSLEPVMLNERGEIMAAYLSFGEGGFLITSIPRLLTNYGLIHPSFSGLVPGILSFFPEEIDVLYWDEWIKVGNRRRNEDPDDDTDSALTYIWQNEALRMAFLIGILSLVLVAAFQVRRIQRLIPPEDTLPNTTLEFTRTVGRLYLQSQQHIRPARKRISAFREYIGRRYYLPLDWKSEEFAAMLAAKSGVEEEQVNRLVRTILHIEAAEKISEEQLLALSQMIDDFYAHRETPFS